MIEIDGVKFPNVIYVEHKEINDAVKLMKPSLDLPTVQFRQQWEIVFERLLSKFFENLNDSESNVGLTIVLRAANAGFLAMKERLLAHSIPIFTVWANRDEETIKASILHCNLPKEIPKGMQALMVDPMCATATSIDETIKELKSCGFEALTFVCGIVTPEGLKFLKDEHPDVKIITGLTGPNIGLNKKGYIIYLDTEEPVAGDVGDRWMGITGDGELIHK
ncbi:MAG: uracil phosphoribosyltransferase [Patescibacteria group bacterium]|nr:uracil phosphoribosyltransferase [Patescibacteria group bacterium]